MATTMDGNRKRDDFDVYDVPDSPPPAKRPKNESWRPWDLSQNAPGNTIHVSTPNKRTGAMHRSTTPRPEPTMIKRIHEALKAKPDEGFTIDGILEWIRTNQSTYYQQRGLRTVRNAIQTTLRQQSRRNKPTVWEYEDGTWRLDKAVFAGPNAEEITGTHAERQTYTPSVLNPSSAGGRTSDGTPASYEDMPRSALEQTGDRDQESGQDVQPTAFLQAESDNGPTSTDNQPRNSASETDAHVENETLQSDTAVLGALTAGNQQLNHKTLTQQLEFPAGGTLMRSHGEPSTIEEGRVSVDSCNDPFQVDKVQSDIGKIVLKLRKLKQDRKAKEQTIEAGHESLPDLSVLAQSAEEAQRAADEAERVAKTAKKAFEDALEKESQIVADKRLLEKLIRDYDHLRSQLDID